METGLVISLPILTALIALATFYFARKKDTKSEAKTMAIIQNDLQHIKDMLTSLISDFKQIHEQFVTMSNRVTRLEEEFKQLDKRVNKIEEDK